MHELYALKQLERAATSGRLRSMAIYAQTVASNDPTNLDAVGLHLKGLITSGALRQAENIIQSLDNEIYNNDHIAVAYFDLLALEERYGELFYHVWLGFNNEYLSEAYAYMERALSVLDTRTTILLLAAKALFSCQLEVPPLSGQLSPGLKQKVYAEAGGTGRRHGLLTGTESGSAGEDAAGEQHVSWPAGQGGRDQRGDACQVAG